MMTNKLMTTGGTGASASAVSIKDCCMQDSSGVYIAGRDIYAGISPDSLNSILQFLKQQENSAQQTIAQQHNTITRLLTIIEKQAAQLAEMRAAALMLERL